MERNISFIHLIIIVLVSSIALNEADVIDLNGNAEFRSVNLRWKYRIDLPDVSSFVIRYCEDQAWGKYRCKNKIVGDDSINAIQETDRDLIYETKIDNLRMATNYTIEVNPLIGGNGNGNGRFNVPPPQRARALGSHLWIQTKGFFARTINCLADKSLIEIETGPYFGGKISVEGSSNPLCSVQGDSSSGRTSYELAISHDLCRSTMNVSSVKSFIIVQENLPILTHSTRRFMVICKYVPETFTVRAGVNLPDSDDSSSHNLVPIDKDVFEVDPSELFDSTNNLFNSRVGQRVGKALKYSSKTKADEPQRWAHMVLMVVLVMAALIGVSCAVGHFIKNSSKFRNRSRSILNRTESSVMGTVNDESPLSSIGSSNNAPDLVTAIPPGGNHPMPEHILGALHPLDFELDNDFNALTANYQPLEKGPSILLANQMLVNEDPSLRQGNDVLSGPLSLLVPSPCLVSDTRQGHSNILLPPDDFLAPCPELFLTPDTREDDFTINERAAMTCNEESDSTDSTLESDCVPIINESDDNVPIAKVETMDSIGGIEINWHLKNEKGIVFPVTSV